MSNLNPDGFMTVEGVRYGEWIPPLKAYGPLGRCTIKIKEIINLLNNDIDVVLRDDQNQDLYFLVKQHNETAKNFKQMGLIPALKAEEILYQRVYKKTLVIEKEDDKINPFISDEENLDSTAEAILLTPTNTSANTMKDPLKNIRKQNKIERPHAYDIFASTVEEKTLAQQLDDANDLLEFGGIDFEL